MERVGARSGAPETWVERAASGVQGVAVLPRFRRRKNPRKTQTAIVDPPVVGNGDRAPVPESSETLVISRERKWLLRQDLNL